MKSFEFSYYNEKEFEEFLDNLSIKEMQKFTETIKNVEEKGFAVSSRMLWTKKIEG